MRLPTYWLLASLLALTACSPGSAPPDPSATGGTDRVGPPSVVVTRGDVESVLTLDAVAVPESPLQVRAPRSGAVVWEVEPGQAVDSNELLARAGGDAVPAPAAGVLSEVHVESGGVVSAGDVLAAVAPSSFVLRAVVPPESLYRLYGLTDDVTARIDRGPGPFACGTASVGADPKALQQGNPLDVPVDFTCSVPEGVRVFPGVRARVAVVTGRANDVLTIPITAVTGQAEMGVVGRRTDAGIEEVSVELGVTDGHRIEVRSGLSEGDVVLVVPPGVGEAAAEVAAR